MSTQRECRDDFHAFLCKAINQIDVIDLNTPADERYPDRTPGWWLNMMKLRREMQHVLANIDYYESEKP